MTLYITPFGRMMRRRTWSDEEPATTQCDVLVPLNVRAENDAFVITALIPGVKAEDLKIQVVNETVTIQGELPGEEGDSFLLRERPSGRFCRVVNLPDVLDAAKSEADLKEGVLTLRVPKAEEALPKTIKITAK